MTSPRNQRGCAPETTRFAGRVAVVTGGAAGIGEAVVRAFVAEGGAAVVLDRDGSAGAELERQLSACRFLEGDAGEETSVQRAVDLAVAAFGRLDYADANAGVGSNVSLPNLSLEDWERDVATNLTGGFLLVTHALRAMRAGGSIVVTSSPHALATSGATASYSASKAGLLGLMRSAALDAAPHGVRINAVLPGPTATRMIANFVEQSSDPQAAARMFDRLAPLGRVAEPSEIAAGVLFLWSDAASFVTGTALAIDGGMLAALSGGARYED